jgi:glycosyltransferase involved in cell wall biosynthesis
MSDLGQINLVLFFTRGVSLKTWDTVGMFEREVAIYRRLQEHGVQVSFVTYGDASDLAYADRLPGIRILCNRWGLPARRYTRLAPLLHWRQMWRGDIFKTHQTEGAEVAFLAKRLFGKKMIARAGFMWSVFLKNAGTFSYDAESLIRREREAFTRADWVVVTTALMKEYAVENYGLPSAKVQVIPNYVLTDLFAPSRESRQSRRRIIYVGRFSQEKNLLGLLEAIGGLDVELIMIGDGLQRQQLEERATSYGINVRFLGNRPHYELPKFLNQADLFVLLTSCEGHPKTLLEAMACGLPVIGADSPGIREMIEHRQTGFLCGPSPYEIRAAILEVLGDDRLKTKMGRLAREFVVENFSIDEILKLELNLLYSLATGG